MKARISLNREQFNDLIRGKTVKAQANVDSHVEFVNVEIGLQDIGYDAILEDVDEAYDEFLNRK